MAPRWGGVSQGRLYETPKKNARANDACEGARAAFDNFAQNKAGTCEEKWHKFDTRCSTDVPAGSGDILAENENPDALAGAIGADVHSWTEWLDHNLNRQDTASALARAVANCAPADRIMFLETLLDSLSPGWPDPNVYGLMDGARSWAGIANRAERKAYALACYESLPAADQMAFLDHVQGRAAA